MSSGAGAPASPPWWRVLFALTVLTGVFLMHSLALAPSSHASPDHHAAAAADPHDESPTAVVHSQAPAQDCGPGQCQDHSMIHLCVAILAALGTALVLLLLVRRGTSPVGRRPERSFTGRVTGRAPPWTAPTLAGLSVLRL